MSELSELLDSREARTPQVALEPPELPPVLCEDCGWYEPCPCGCGWGWCVELHAHRLGEWECS